MIVVLRDINTREKRWAINIFYFAIETNLSGPFFKAERSSDFMIKKIFDIWLDVPTLLCTVRISDNRKVTPILTPSRVRLSDYPKRSWAGRYLYVELSELWTFLAIVWVLRSRSTWRLPFWVFEARSEEYITKTNKSNKQLIVYSKCTDYTAFKGREASETKYVSMKCSTLFYDDQIWPEMQNFPRHLASCNYIFLYFFTLSIDEKTEEVLKYVIIKKWQGQNFL